MADVVVRMSGDEAKLYSSFQRIIRQQSKLESGLGKNVDVGKRINRTFSKMYKGAIRDVGSMVVGFASVQKAVQGVTAALAKQIEMRKEASSRISTAEEGRRALGQVATTDKEYESLMKLSRRFRTEQGMTETAALRLTFNLKSAGQQFVEQPELFGSLADISLDPSIAVGAVQKLQSAFGGAGAGREGGGTARQIVNKILAAAGEAPVMASEIAGAVSVASASFAEIGGQDEELLAMAGVLSETFRSPLATTEKIKSLSDQLMKKRKFINFEGMEELKGLDLVMALPQLAKEGRLGTESKQGVDLTEFLGEANAMQAMSLLQKRRGDVLRRVGEISASEVATGGQADILSKRAGIVGARPELAASKAQRKTEQAKLAYEEERYGAASKIADALEADLQLDLQKKGKGAIKQWASSRIFEATRLVSGDEDFIKRFESFSSPETRAEISTWRRNLQKQALNPSTASNETRAAYFEAIGLSDLAETHRSSTGDSSQVKAALEKLNSSAENMNKAAEHLNQAAQRTQPTALGNPGEDR